MQHKSYFRVVVAFSLALAIATSLWFASPAMLYYAQAQGYGGGGGGGGAGGIIPLGFTSLEGSISTEGVMIYDVTAQSFDELGQLRIDRGTRALDRLGNSLYWIIMIELEFPPPPPADFTIFGPVYDFGPEGATFKPAITLYFTYDPALLPKGVSLESLVIAMWDEATGKWVMLDSIVDTNNITTQVSEFTPFTILASTAPAAFTVTDLTLSPAEADIGEMVIITVLVINSGDLTGSYEVILEVGEVIVATEEVMLSGRASQEVTFTTAKDVAGTYTVDVNGLAGTFEVREALPPPPSPAPPPPVPPPPILPPAKLINWWFVGITTIAGFIIIGVVIWRVARRRGA